MSNDAEILHPDHEVVIKGETVIVREFGRIDEQRVARLVNHAITGIDATDDLEFDYLRIYNALYLDPAAMDGALIICTRMESDWIKVLSPDDYETLAKEMILVNAFFFGKRLQIVRMLATSRSERST